MCHESRRVGYLEGQQQSWGDEKEQRGMSKKMYMYECATMKSIPLLKRKLIFK